MLMVIKVCTEWSASNTAVTYLPTDLTTITAAAAYFCGYLPYCHYTAVLLLLLPTLLHHYTAVSTALPTLLPYIILLLVLLVPTLLPLYSCYYCCYLPYYHYTAVTTAVTYHYTPVTTAVTYLTSYHYTAVTTAVTCLTTC